MAGSISDIIARMRALKNEIDALPWQPNVSASQDISRLLRPGDGVLERIRDPVGVSEAVSAPANDSDNEVDEAASSKKQVRHIEDEGGAASSKKRVKQIEDEDDPDRKGMLGEDEALRFLQSLRPEIQTRFSVGPAAPPSSLHSDFQPYHHQSQATALGVRAENTPFEGMILADPPRLGKTLPTWVTSMLARQTGGGPIVLVVPSSCTHQWMDASRSYYAEEITGVLLLNDNNVSPFDLFRYKIIVTSYEQVTSDYRRLAKFKQSMEAYRQGANIAVPKRPKLTLLSGIWGMDGVQSLRLHLPLETDLR